MRIAPHDLTNRYSAALREYGAKGEEAALYSAYELGRRAAVEGLGVLEMAALHQKALVEVLLDMLTADETTRMAHRASEFLAEALAPFESTHLRYQEEHSTLCDLNQSLERWLHAIRHKLEVAQAQLLERKRAEALNNEFIVMSHEMHGSLSVLKSGLGGQLNSHGQRLLDVALRNSERVMRLLADTPAGKTIESNVMTFGRAAGSGSGSS